MKRKRIRLSELEPLYGYSYLSQDKLKLLQEIGLDKLPPIPVIEIPERLRVKGRIYSHLDGHHRHKVAVSTGTDSLDCILYDETDNLEEVSKLTGPGHIYSYPQHISVLETYLDKRFRSGFI